MDQYPLENLGTYAMFRDLRQHYQQFGFLTSTTASSASASAFTLAVLHPHVSVCLTPVVAVSDAASPALDTPR